MSACILCVEDEPSLLGDLVDDLRDGGYQVLAAADGREALQLMQRHRPDLVLCDITMPVMDGLTLLRQLRASGLPAADVPFIFLTAHGQKSDQIRGRDLGADDYLTKPVDFDLLHSVLKSRLRGVERAQRPLRDELGSLQQTMDDISNRALAMGFPGRRALLETLQGLDESLPADLLLVTPAGLTEMALRGDAAAARQALNELLAQLQQAMAGRVLPVFQLSESVFALLAQRLGPAAPDLDRLRALTGQPAGDGFHRGSQMVLAPLSSRTRTDATQIVDEVLVALYLARRDGQDFLLIDESEGLRLRRLHLIENALLRALEARQLHLEFEPKLRLADRRIVGAEALIRWRSEELGSIPPSLFVPIAERLGMIRALTHFTLNAALDAAAQLQAAATPLPIALNLSSLDLGEGLAATIEAGLAQRGLPVQCLEVEITETATVKNFSLALSELRALHRLGLRITIDDFGTGHGSLLYLSRFPVSGLKIDRIFTQALETSARDRTIVRAMIDIARPLQLEVVAEGIETEAQLRWLRELGCEIGQGYLFSRSLPLSQLQARLA